MKKQKIWQKIISMMLAFILIMAEFLTHHVYTTHAAEVDLYEQNFIEKTALSDITDWEFSADVTTEAKASSWSIADEQLVATVTRVTGPGQAQAALKTEEAINWSNYSFSVDVTTEKSSENTYATVGIRAYAQANTIAEQEKECYEFRSTLLSSGKYNLELYKTYKNDQGSRVAQKVANTTYSPTDLSHAGAEAVTYNVKINVLDGVIKCYIDGTSALEYSAAGEEASGYKAPYSKGTVGLFVSTYGSKATTYTVKLDNMKVSKDVKPEYNKDFTGVTDTADITDWEFSKTVSDEKKASSWSIAEEQLMATVTRVTGAGQAVAALKTEEAVDWSNYSFRADVTVDRISANKYATVAMRAYAQANTAADQEDECYEFRSTLLASGKYTIELYKAYKNEQGSRVAQKVANTTYTPMDLSKAGADSVTYNAKIQVLDGNITLYINGESALVYSTVSEEASGWKTPYSAGTIGFFIMTNGSTAATYTVKLDNIVVAEAVAEEEPENPDTPTEPEGRACNVAGDENFRVVLVDDFSSDRGTWEWEGLDSGNGDWEIANGVLSQKTDNSSLTTVILSDENSYEFGAVVTDIMFTSQSTGNVYGGMVAGYNGNKNYYHLRLADKSGTYLLQLYKIVEGKAVALTAVDLTFSIERNKWYQLELQLLDGKLLGLVDGSQLLTYDISEEETIFDFGSAGVRSSQGSASFDNFGVKIPREATVVEDGFGYTSLDGKAWSNENADANDQGIWTVGNEVLVQSNDATNVNTIMLYDDSVNIKFGGVSADVKFTSANTGNLYAGPVAAYNGAQNYYHLRIGDMKDTDAANPSVDKLQLFQMTAGKAAKLAEADLAFKLERDKWYNVELYNYNGTLMGYVDDVLYLTYKPDEGIVYTEGLAGVRVSQGTAQIDNFKAYGAAASGGSVESNTTVVDNPLVFSDDFQDEISGTSPDYWLENNTMDNWKVSGNGEELYYGCDRTDVTATSWLHVFETNVDYSAKLKVPASVAADARVGLVVRMTAQDAYVKVGYDFAQSKWYIKDRKGADFEEHTIWAAQTSEFSKDTWNIIRVYAVGKTVQIYCNDVLVVESNDIDQVTTGRAGVFTEKTAVWLDDVSLSLLSGQGRVEKAALANYILPRDMYTEGASLFWLSDDVALINIDSDLFVSEDQGQTFRAATTEELETYAFFRQSARTQYIRLHTGNILKVDNFTGGKAYLSTDNGATYSQVGAMWQEAELESNWQYYGGMNDMLKEVRLADGSYRVFYCADARATGNADGSGSVIYHWEEVYYSDDEGRTWQKSEFDTRVISGLNHVCESRIVACSDGDLRMYCTWNDSDCIRYYESHDNGATWEGEYAIPEMSCARSSHALMEDSYNPGTTYMAFVHDEPATWDATTPRSRLVLMRTTNGKNWEFLMDCLRWEDVPDDRVGNINQVVDPSITVTEDYIFVLTGWSEESDNTSHQKQRQHILKLKKADLTAYEAWPGTADAKDIVTIEVTAPDKVLYQKGESLDLTGGSITVHYYDGTTEPVALTADGVEITEPDEAINYTVEFAAPDMNECGTKLLRVTYKNFADNFRIQVSEEGAAPTPPPTVAPTEAPTATPTVVPTSTPDMTLPASSGEDTNEGNKAEGEAGISGASMESNETEELSSPDTGDISRGSYWLVIMILTSGIAVWLILKRKRV